MLKQAINHVRDNILESPKFYYWVLCILTLHLVLRHSLIKALHLSVYEELLTSKVITAVLYGTTYLCCVLSAYLMKNRLSKLYLYFWLYLFCLSLLNEIIFIINSDNYDFVSSVVSGQGFMNLRITFPLLFVCIWIKLDVKKGYTQLFLKIIYLITIINSICVILGVIFSISYFESYPLSGRWGYSGFLTRGYSVIFSSVFMLDILFKKNSLKNVVIYLLFFSVIFSGTKAGLFSLFLILLAGFVKTIKAKLIASGLIVFFFTTSKYWFKEIIEFSDFWSSVYANHGLWGMVFSLRNKNVEIITQSVVNDYNIINWLFGGGVRSEDVWAEMSIFDLFVFYGLTGWLFALVFYYKTIPSIRHSVPMLVGFLSGNLIISSMALIVYYLWLNESRKYA